MAAVCHTLRRVALLNKLKQMKNICGCRLKDFYCTSSDKSSMILLPTQHYDFAKRLYSTDEKVKARPTVDNTLDEEELANFSRLAASWWDESGEFIALHSMNKLRIPFIRDALMNNREGGSVQRCLPLDGLKIVDAGSGGGLLAEPLARLGAFVVGVDPVEDSTTIAQLHLQEDPAILPRVKYITGSVEDLVPTEHEEFDAVVASEVIEHINNLESFIESCCKLVKPGGSLFVTTINKTQLARATAVFAAERILRIVPPGTHDWEKFVPPEDLQYIIDKAGLSTRVIHGLLYNPLMSEWRWIKDTSVNYALHAVKPDRQTPEPDQELRL